MNPLGSRLKRLDRNWLTKVGRHDDLGAGLERDRRDVPVLQSFRIAATRGS